MQMIKPKIINRLYLQVSAIFLLVLILFTAITLYISVGAARDYSVEVNQRLNRELAKSTANEIKSHVKEGVVGEQAIKDIMHSMMVINPSVEVYLLDPAGKILNYVAPYKVVKLEEVSLDPIKRFLDVDGQNLIFGDDPRNPGEVKTFSAAPMFENDELIGYIYIVLASQEYVSEAETLVSSYILGLSIRSVVMILFISVLIGLLAIWFITKKLNPIIDGINLFKEGNLDTRISVKSENELNRIGLVFNQMADTIQQNIQELKGIDNLRRDLISNVSHDLRTPVASIQGYAETLILKQDNITKDEQGKYLNIIYKSCGRLKKLVEELFELSKLEANQVKPDTEPFSIAELVYDVANKYRIISQKKGIGFNTVIAKDIPLVEADLSMIDRVLQNLIDNAVKFCEEGDSINIEIEKKETGYVEVRVADSGQGIKQEDLPNVFQRYYKGRNDHQSTGLGLAIVKKIIELHNSQIQVFSQFGKGTTFSFNLPVAAIV